MPVRAATVIDVPAVVRGTTPVGADALTLLKVQVDSVGANNTDISAGFDLLIVDD